MRPKIASNSTSLTWPRKLNPAKVRELAAQGLSIPDIAKHQRVNRSTVWRFLERLSPEQEALKRFQETRPDAFALLHGDTLQCHAPSRRE